MTTSCIKYDFNELRGRIKAKIGTEGEFARLLGRSHNYVSNVLNGTSYFEMKDISKAVEILEIDQSEIGFYFYRRSS